MKKFWVIFSVLLSVVLLGCSDITTNGSTNPASDDFAAWQGNWSYSEVVRGQGTGHVGLSLTSSGIFGFGTTTLYYLYSLKETSSYSDTLDSQKKALWDQYRLGLITREKYESEAKRYQAEYDQKCAPVWAKYKNTSWGGTVKKDSSGYYMDLSGKKYYMKFSVNTIIVDDPITGGTYFLKTYM